VVLLITGYLGVWTLFGVGVHLGDWALHQAAKQSAWLQANAWVPGAVTLVLAGLYQFTPLKYYCLDKCRSPLSFIVEHWRGHHERAQALWLGGHHGIFCLGCCWTLMLLMFAVGVGNLGWMLALGTVMAIEKNLPRGRRLSKLVGMLLIAWGLALALGSALA
jgi:predicted metal-binding membrane protein